MGKFNSIRQSETLCKIYKIIDKNEYHQDSLRLENKEGALF